METPTIAFAPNLDLFCVPSSAINAESSARGSGKVRPQIASEIGPLTLSTARNTPRPP